MPALGSLGEAFIVHSSNHARPEGLYSHGRLKAIATPRGLAYHGLENKSQLSYADK